MGFSSCIHDPSLEGNGFLVVEEVVGHLHNGLVFRQVVS
jgi:hypothetical protein